MSHQGFRFDDYGIWGSFWISINRGYVDMEYKYEFEKFWGKGAKAETIVLSQRDYDALVDRLNEKPKFNQKLYDLMSKKSPWDD
jgi:5-bromo-4-chloroindolyl phosphate hydrolysis protein